MEDWADDDNSSSDDITFWGKKVELRNKQMNYLRLPIHDTTKVTELNFVRPETG